MYDDWDLSKIGDDWDLSKIGASIEILSESLRAHQERVSKLALGALKSNNILNWLQGIDIKRHVFEFPNETRLLPAGWIVATPEG